MPSPPFHGRIRSITAGVLSALAMLGLAAYVLLVPAPSPSLAASYSDSERPHVTGTVTSEAGKAIRGARVTLVFRADGALLERTRVRSGQRGHWRAEIPAGAESVAIGIRRSGAKGSPRAVAEFEIRAGQTLEVTAVFTPRSSGLIPAIFPY